MVGKVQWFDIASYGLHKPYISHHRKRQFEQKCIYSRAFCTAYIGNLCFVKCDSFTLQSMACADLCTQHIMFKHI